MIALLAAIGAWSEMIIGTRGRRGSRKLDPSEPMQMELHRIECDGGLEACNIKGETAELGQRTKILQMGQVKGRWAFDGETAQASEESQHGHR